ncbi:hypothetical protein [Cryobacterium lyxosi]|nr:hypothetical protein [Cryobacterium lyxosi]
MTVAAFAVPRLVGVLFVWKLGTETGGVTLPVIEADTRKRRGDTE